MAFWQYKESKEKRYVFVYTREHGKQKPLPRAMVKHLDSQPKQNIEQWVAQYERQYEHKPVQPQHIHFSDSKLEGYLRSYLTHLAGQNKSDTTIKQHESMLRRFALPYFTNRGQPLLDPQQWGGVSIQLLSWMKGQDITDSVAFRVNVALKGFYRFLYEEGVVHTTPTLKLRSPLNVKQDTPLQFAVTPQDVLAFARHPMTPLELKLLAILRYFFSLRPQEVFALTPRDFAAGLKVESLECAKSMKRSGLFERLAVHVTKQRRSTGKAVVPPKSGSKGRVSCFNEDAAQLLVGLLKQLPPDLPLFPLNNRELYKHWGKDGLANITLKDLRRASLYWLGHNSTLQPIELSKHARHTSFETSMLYLRRPDEALSSTSAHLDLEL